MPLTNEQKLAVASGRADVFLLERKYQDGLEAAERLPDDQLAGFPGETGGLWSKYYCIGFARKALQDQPGARAAFLRARSAAEDALKQNPDAAKLHIQLAKALAYLGEKDAALAEAQRASELLPESKDAFNGPDITEGVAQVQAIVGENDRAIEILDGLLSRPSSVTVQILKDKSDLGFVAKPSAFSSFADQIQWRSVAPRCFFSPLQQRRTRSGRSARATRNPDATASRIGTSF